jgi:hypothetical protein
MVNLRLGANQFREGLPPGETLAAISIERADGKLPPGEFASEPAVSIEGEPMESLS